MPVIEVEHLHKRYGDTVAISDVSFTVEAGEIFGILGPNGAGKTTTVECVSGLRTPDGGTVRVLDRDPGDAALRRLVNDKVRRFAYATAALDRARQAYSWKRVASQLGAVYSAVSGRRTTEAEAEAVA